MKLSEQTAAVLDILAEHTDPAADAGRGQGDGPARKVYAMDVADRLRERGFELRNTGLNTDSTGAANSLRALRRRGLAGRNTPGIFEQAQWWITPEGLEAWRELAESIAAAEARRG